MQTKILEPSENCKLSKLTEPKSAKPTGESLDVLLDCVVIKESLLSAVEQTFWIGSDAVKLSTPTGEGKHLNKYQVHARKHNLVPSLQMLKTGCPLGKYAHTLKANVQYCVAKF